MQKVPINHAFLESGGQLLSNSKSCLGNTNTLYARRCDNVFFNVFVTYGYGLDVNVKAQT
jgi:hypothetical protein